MLRERFGPFSFILKLTARNGRVEWPVERWRFLGIAMPRALMPKSETVEEIGKDGRFRFDVSISAALRRACHPLPRLAGAGSSAQGVSSTGSPAAAPMLPAVLSRAKRPALAGRA